MLALEKPKTAYLRFFLGVAFLGLSFFFLRRARAIYTINATLSLFSSSFSSLEELAGAGAAIEAFLAFFFFSLGVAAGVSSLLLLSRPAKTKAMYIQMYRALKVYFQLLSAIYILTNSN